MKPEDDTYQPVSCELHSQYELAIMHKNRLELSWLAQGELVTASDITPLDVQTRDKAEYLVAVNSNDEKLCLRLDQIKKMRILK